jgi:TATA-box binding protein (TBP) (component of TFIID and TFIIIB)
MTTNENIDNAWKDFMLKSVAKGMNYSNILLPTILDNDGDLETLYEEYSLLTSPVPSQVEEVAPVPTDLYISTNTKVIYLNQKIDAIDLFWKLSLIEYWRPAEGIIRKQAKIVSTTKEDFVNLSRRLEDLRTNHGQFITENIMFHGDNNDKRGGSFKDDRKVTIGVSRKDIMNCRGKVKQAFMNCIAIILRLSFDGQYREMHVKLFNTGKMEIPGILNMAMLDRVREQLTKILTPFLPEKVGFLDNSASQNVLINSNFTCRFSINKDNLYNIMRSSKYNLEVTHDPCHYPGLKCKYYYKNDRLPNEQNGCIHEEDRSLTVAQLDRSTRYTRVMFMIFRTGSCLILGNCTEEVIHHIYAFVCNILATEYKSILANCTAAITKLKKSKPRKRKVNVSEDYYNTLSYVAPHSIVTEIDDDDDEICVDDETLAWTTMNE